MKKLLLIFFITLSVHCVFAQTTATKKTKKKTKKENISTKGLSDAEKEILGGSKGAKNRKTKKSKNERISKQEKKVELKKAPALMYKPIQKNGKTLTGNISTVQGFRICIYNGSSREDAFTIKKAFAMYDSKLKSYMVYNRPNFKIKVGDFDNKKVATKELKRIKEKYPSAFITPDIVIVKKLEVHRVIKLRKNNKS